MSGTESRKLYISSKQFGEVEKAMANNVERGGCRFSVKKTSEGKPSIVMELFHETVPRLAGITLSFEVLSGITLEQTRDLGEKMNDQIVGVIVWRLPRRQSTPAVSEIGSRIPTTSEEQAAYKRLSEE